MRVLSLLAAGPAGPALTRGAGQAQRAQPVSLHEGGAQQAVVRVQPGQHGGVQGGEGREGGVGVAREGGRPQGVGRRGVIWWWS